jgi:hypothetical protein
MAEHGDNHKQYEGDGQKLGEACGHHCGIIPTAPGHTHENHCNCAECHNSTAVVSEIPTFLTSPEASSGVDPKTIT